MPPRGGKHWCKLCRKSFPSCYSLGGHMNLHSGKRKQKKKLSRTTPSLANIAGGAGGYGLRERRHSTWLRCDSSDDEQLTPAPMALCHLCFKVFASRGALTMHMRGCERKMVAKEVSDEYCDHNVPVSTPVTLTYGMEEVNAARVLMMISGHSGMYSAYEHCAEDYEMDGNLAYRVQKSGMELGYSQGHRQGQTEDAELMPESNISDVKLKFTSLSHVLKATASHDCRLCGKVFTSSKGLASHKKFHKVRDHEKVAASPKSAMPETGKQLLEVDLNLPGLNDRNYSRRSPKSELTPWWTKRGFRCDQMLDVV